MLLKKEKRNLTFCGCGLNQFYALTYVFFTQQSVTTRSLGRPSKQNVSQSEADVSAKCLLGEYLLILLIQAQRVFIYLFIYYAQMTQMSAWLAFITKLKKKAN